MNSCHPLRHNQKQKEILLALFAVRNHFKYICTKCNHVRTWKTESSLARTLRSRHSNYILQNSVCNQVAGNEQNSHFYLSTSSQKDAEPNENENEYVG